MRENDSDMQCKKCGRSTKVNFAHCLRRGWPKCCGATMKLLSTDADIDAAVGEALSPVKGFFND